MSHLITNSSSVFSEQTFELLEGISATPQLSYYQENQRGFRQYVEEPFQRVMSAVAASLPSAISAVMETDRRIFGKFHKNDFGLGGAWPYYWGAFYPKGSKRSRDAQLSMWMNYEMLEYGFYIGDYGSTQRQRFVRNCAAHRTALEELMESLIDSESIFFGDRQNFVVADSGAVSYKDDSRPTWSDFLANPERFNCDASFVLSRSALLQLKHDKLTERVLNGHTRLFPLVLAATADDPLPLIEQYLADQFPDEVEPEIPHPANPLYTLEQMAEATGFPVETIAAWVSGVKRKGQAILYGPPGTGKTFLAKHLARHLIGGGDGMTDIVQFHPAYAYEDFMQGIRPRPNPGGGLDYPVIPGRFLEFCRTADRRHGPCVLIIDEINRANLARVFGELMYLLEYRDQDIPLAAGGQRFGIPANVYIIGTMNTADRSIALVDHALRRRFAFLEVRPDYAVLRRYLAACAPSFPSDRLVGILQRLNRQIDDAHYEVGISYFMSTSLTSDLQDIWRMEIQPYLDEYFFDRRETAAEFAWDNIRRDLQL